MEFEITKNLESIFSIYSTPETFFNITRQILFSLRSVDSKLQTQPKAEIILRKAKIPSLIFWNFEFLSAITE